MREGTMLKLVVILLVALVAPLLVSSSTVGGVTGPDRARLLASKRLHNMYLVEGNDIVVHYCIYNIGTAAALNVQLTDAGFSTDNFDVVGGQLQVKFDRIPPNANVSHTIVVQPKQFGYYNFTAAEVSYLPSEDSTEIQISYTSEPGQGGIIAERDYNKKFSPHVFDWVVFALLLTPVLMVPFLMWHKISTKYAPISKPSKGRRGH